MNFYRKRNPSNYNPSNYVGPLLDCRNELLAVTKALCPERKRRMNSHQAKMMNPFQVMEIWKQCQAASVGKKKNKRKKKEKKSVSSSLYRGAYKVTDILLPTQCQPGMGKAWFHFLLLFVLLKSLSFILQENVITIRQQAILGSGMEGIRTVSHGSCSSQGLPKCSSAGEGRVQKRAQLTSTA